MKNLKSLWLVPLVLALFLTNAAAADWFMGLDDYTAGVPSQMEKEGKAAGLFFRGTLASISEESRQVVINTTVPGFFGPQLSNVPFTINDDTTMTICIQSTGKCENAASGTEGWEMLTNVENLTSLSLAKKDVVVVSDPETGRTVHMEILYEL